MVSYAPYKPNILAFLVLVVCVLSIIFLVIAAIYFMNLMNLKPPTTSEATGLFAVSIIGLVIFMALLLYAAYSVYPWKVPISSGCPVVYPETMKCPNLPAETTKPLNFPAEAAKPPSKSQEMGKPPATEISFPPASESTDVEFSSLAPPGSTIAPSQ